MDIARRHSVILVVAVLGSLASALLAAEPKGTSRKKVLVELYTSQGCDMCPAADQMLARLGALGYGPDRIVPLSFHVDYFNTPWKDVFSDAAFSQREQAYNEALKRNDLYFTPMLMVDGRYPMLGSDQPKAKAALDRALKQKPGVTLALELAKPGDDPGRRTLKATVTAETAETTGRDQLVGVALVENPTVTDVPAGENAGKTLIEHFTVRKFAYQKIQLEPSKAKEVTFPLELLAGQDAGRSGVAVFVQDWLRGEVHQAESLPWRSSSEPETATPTLRGKRPRRGSSRTVPPAIKPLGFAAPDR